MSTNVRAFLAAIRWCEGTADPDGYRRIVGGDLFEDFTDHPRAKRSGVFANGKAWSSTAAGAYQFIEATWDSARAALGLPNFSPPNQDEAAIWLIKKAKALQDVEDGNLRAAIAKCAPIWASLPGAPYGQPTKTYEAVERVYLAAGGFLSSQAGGATPPVPSPTPPPEPAPPASISETIMAIPALVTAAASALLPIVADLFRARGSKTSERNADIIETAAPVIMEIARTVAPAANDQASAEAILSSKDLQAQFRAAMALKWSDVEPFFRAEEESREAARKFVGGFISDGPQWRQIGASVLIAVLSLTIVVGGGWMFWNLMDSPQLDPGQKGLILGALLASFSTVVGFWFGSSRSSQMKDEAIAEATRK